MIPGARYEELEGTGHLLFIERSDEFNETVIDFLDGMGTDDRTNSGSRDNNGWWQKIVSLISGGNGGKGSRLKN